MSQTAPSAPPENSRRSLVSVAVALPILLAAIVWAYWGALANMAVKWESDPQYSHGYLVPLFSLALLWLRVSKLNLQELKPSWWGLPLLVAGVSMRLAGAFFYLEWFDSLSLIPCLGGVCLLLGGHTAFRWSWPAIAFLFFMIPLPHTIEVAMRNPLRQIGTSASTYVMQTIGLPAVSEGNIVIVDNNRIGVNEACSGLRMMMIFFALSTAVALLSERALWERALIVVSAVPIALISNITRITVTAILHVTLAGKTVFGVDGHKIADVVFHDLAGWLMMPFALLVLWGELWFLSRLFIVEEDRPLSVDLQTSHREITAVG